MDLQIYYSIPSEWVRLLRLIQTNVPGAIIAGGCLRDYFNDRPVNDIDIFVPYYSALMVGYLIRDTHPKLVKSIPEPYFTHNSDVRSVSYYEGDRATPVNIIGVSPWACAPEQQLKRFDYGICRVAYDGITLWKDLTFDRDMRDKTFTLTSEYQSESQLAYSLGRFERLSTKYPGWKLVRPAPLAPFDSGYILGGESLNEDQNI